MKYLRELSNMFWVRPENALWVTKVMQVMDGIEFERPSLDLMCGHGMWSFIRAGGDFGSSWDSYKALQDLGNYQDGTDIQDTFSDEYRPEITRRPDYRIDCGFDWKENNLKKCEALDFYDRLVQGDCNKPLPFKDNEFKTVFSNTVYWVDDIEHILKELTRIIQPDGKVVLVNYLPGINQYLDVYKDRASDEWLQLIDRNRSIENKHIFEKDEWIRLLDQAGPELTEYIPSINKLCAHIWNIGLRPFAGYILDMAQNLTPEKYADMKRGWVDTLVILAEPFLSDPLFTESREGEEAEAIFVLRKK